MKKIIVYIISFVLICFIIPIIFTNSFKIKEVMADNKEEINNDTNVSYDYGKYNKVKLLHVSTGEIEELGLDQ